MPKYKLVTTTVMGYELTQVKKRILLFWWVVVLEHYPDETFAQFSKRGKEIGVDILSLPYEEKILYP